LRDEESKVLTAVSNLCIKQLRLLKGKPELFIKVTNFLTQTCLTI